MTESINKPCPKCGRPMTCMEKGRYWCADCRINYYDDDYASVKFIPTHDDTEEELVDHPAHYGGKDDPYEAIKVIEAWGLGFHLGNAVKYIARAGKKNPDTEIEDLRKAVWYINRFIELKEGKE